MSNTDEAAVREVLGRYAKSLNDADADDAVAQYARDGVYYPYNLPTATGTDELLAAYRQIFATIRLDIAFTVHEVVVDGDLAYATTGSKGLVTVLEPDVTAPEENREVFVLKRSGGDWKIARYMFNKPAAPGD
ncbi:YybH family protein [Antrihabitans sp. NCIMB 15449]|uniref:YybH family protein n=1 Tax=Antrihabitans spumae TaxID=3373370 RepID=A0ABW7JP07_9NOCA